MQRGLLKFGPTKSNGLKPQPPVLLFSAKMWLEHLAWYEASQDPKSVREIQIEHTTWEWGHATLAHSLMPLNDSQTPNTPPHLCSSPLILFLILWEKWSNQKRISHTSTPTSISPHPASVHIVQVNIHLLSSFQGHLLSNLYFCLLHHQFSLVTELFPLVYKHAIIISI